MAMSRPQAPGAQPRSWPGFATPPLPRPVFGRRVPAAQHGIAIWQRGDGDARLVGDGTGTLLLLGTGLTAAAIAAAILPDRGGRPPAPLADAIDVTGLSGRMLIGAELICFRGFARIAVDAV